MYGESCGLKSIIKVLCNSGFWSREQDGSETLRHPVDILLLELMKAYIFRSL